MGKSGKVRRCEGAKVRRCKVGRWILLLCYFLPSSVLLTLTAFSFPALEGVVEEGFHAAGLGGWCMPEVGRFVVGGVGSAAFEDTMEGEVKKGPVCGGFHIWVLAVIPIVVEKATAAVHAKNAPCRG